MTWVIVQRGSGNYPCPPITDPYITEDPVAIERGRNELDFKSSNVQEVTMSTVFRVGVKLGQLVRVLDEFQGIAWFGKITGIEHSVVGGVLSTQLSVERKI